MSLNETERRSLVGCALRADVEGPGFRLIGRAASFNVLSELGIPAPGCREKLLPGCFSKSLQRADTVYCLHNHNNDLPLGKTGAGLELSEDARGLNFRVQLNPAVELHKSIHALTLQGVISSCSFSFRCTDEGWGNEVDDTGESVSVRYIREATLLDVSVLSALPAYGGNSTAVAARNANSAPTADLRARLAEMDRDIANHERLHTIDLAILADQKRAIDDDQNEDDDQDNDYQNALDDFASGRFRAIGASDNFIYAISNEDNDLEEENCYRIGYKTFADKSIKIVGDAKRLRLEDVCSAAPRWFDKIFESRANQRLEQKRRLRNLAGIVSR